MAATLPIAKVTSKNLRLITEIEAIHTSRQARASGSAQPQYLAQQLDVNRIQAALRAAERGDTWQYFTIVRDMISGYAHLGTEWMKRKSVIVGQP